MGLLARLLGSDPETRVNRAQKFLERGEYNDARLELDGVSHPRAEALREQARDGLIGLNLAEARARFSAGDPDGGNDHLALAGQFGASADDLRDVRRLAREVRAAERAAKAQQAAKTEIVVPEGDDPLWRLPPDDPRVRYAMVLEAWPEDLRERLAGLGADFAKAVMAIEDGRGGQVVEALGQFVGDEPAARYERARAALQAGHMPLAASDLQSFGEAVGHRRIGPVHTAVMLARLLGQLGRPEEAITMLERELAQRNDPALAGARAGLLEAVGRNADAERAAEKLLLTAPRDQGLYRLLARTRARQGKRIGAMQALEGGLARTCSSPGKCGNQPYDVAAARMLAQLYLEDRIEPKRTRELLGELERKVERPGWHDRYLSTLVARNDGMPGLQGMVQRLRAELPPGDPRLQTVARAFPQLLEASA